jgi:hypothetical protein
MFQSRSPAQVFQETRRCASSVELRAIQLGRVLYVTRVSQEISDHALVKRILQCRNSEDTARRTNLAWMGIVNVLLHPLAKENSDFLIRDGVIMG